MSPLELLTDLRGRGVRVGLRRGKLVFSSDTPLSVEDATTLKTRKAELKRYLERRYSEILAWAETTLNRNQNVWLESPLHADAVQREKRRHEHPGDLAACLIWLETWGLGYEVTTPKDEGFNLNLFQPLTYGEARQTDGSTDIKPIDVSA